GRPALPREAQLDLASGKLAYVETPAHEVDAALPSPKGRWLAWLVNAGGRSELKLRALENNRTLTAPGLPLGVVSQMEFAPDDGRLAFVLGGPRYNPDVWVWDLLSTSSQPRGPAH